MLLLGVLVVVLWIKLGVNSVVVVVRLKRWSVLWCEIMGEVFEVDDMEGNMGWRDE